MLFKINVKMVCFRQDFMEVSEKMEIVLQDVWDLFSSISEKKGSLFRRGFMRSMYILRKGIIFKIIRY